MDGAGPSHLFGASKFIVGDAFAETKKLEDNSFKLIISSPPYNIGKPYEVDDKRSLAEYVDWQAEIIGELIKKLHRRGSICWQVGNYVRGGEIFPLDLYFLPLFHKSGLKLRNRIIWKFNFGYNADQRFSGRYETILWLTKSEDYTFNLDPVRIPQIYPGKTHGKNRPEKRGTPSGNPRGKNPSDYWEFSVENDFRLNPIWDIPNVKANHPEKEDSHPCQFPVELAERCVLALTNRGDKVLDPFVGVGASVIAAVKQGRDGVGIDQDADFIGVARKRVRDLRAGKLVTRPLGKPVRQPKPNEKVARRPAGWGGETESETDT